MFARFTESFARRAKLSKSSVLQRFSLAPTPQKKFISKISLRIFGELQKTLSKFLHRERGSRPNDLLLFKKIVTTHHAHCASRDVRSQLWSLNGRLLAWSTVTDGHWRHKRRRRREKDIESGADNGPKSTKTIPRATVDVPRKRRLPLITSSP